MINGSGGRDGLFSAGIDGFIRASVQSEHGGLPAKFREVATEFESAELTAASSLRRKVKSDNEHGIL